MEFTTIEKLQMSASASYGVVIQYGDKVLVSDITWKGGFTAEIYEFIAVSYTHLTLPTNSRV